jgi:nucleoside-diphosphate-sugar epimerase
MRTGIVGYTGFVGSNLAANHSFDELFNSSNVQSIRGKSFDLLVTAANRADAHRINADPESDWREIQSLTRTLSQARVGKLVLISTVCVYPSGGSPDEYTPLQEGGLTPYGRNRLRQERILSDQFDTVVLRLPQLFGLNMSKGIVYDLLNDHRVEHIDPRLNYQLYDLRELWGLVTQVIERGIATLNVATEPLSAGKIAQEVFGIDLAGQAGDSSANEGGYSRNMTSAHADLLANASDYLCSSDAMLSKLREFVHAQVREAGGR